MVKTDWKTEAWESFLQDKWDNRPKSTNVVFYTTLDLAPYLSKYAGSAVGEIRLFHSGHEKLQPVLKRGIIKLPITRSKWALTLRPSTLSFSEPSDEKILSSNTLTDGMKLILTPGSQQGANPGETSLLAIAKQVGILNDFYEITDELIWFTGGRQNANGVDFTLEGQLIDISKGQIEIDGAFEAPNEAVIVEMKSNLKQSNFDPNQCLIPWLKWQKLLGHKDVKSMVLLFSFKNGHPEYWAYDLAQKDSGSPFDMEVLNSKKYIISN